MTLELDEAIKHCEEVAEEQGMKAGFETDYQCYQMSDAERNQCKECANEHQQLAEWLKDYKRLLEQEPCEDAISRQAVLDIWHTTYSDNREENEETQYKKIAFELPPVTPQHTDAEIQKMQEMEQAEIQKAYELGKEDKIKVLDKVRGEIDKIYEREGNSYDCLNALDDLKWFIDKYKESEE